MARAARTVSVIGAGRIGSAVIAYIKDAPEFRLGRILTRSGRPDTGHIDDFLATPADLVVDAAGPLALRDLGPRCLEKADLWTVGAAALADAALLSSLTEVGKDAGTTLTLFAPWAFGIGLAPRDGILSLTLCITRPDLPDWSGPLSDAARQFPGEVNFALAAALNGPGIDRTRVEFRNDAPPGSHSISARCRTEAGLCTSTIDFSGAGRHPTALSLIAALECRSRVIA